MSVFKEIKHRPSHLGQIQLAEPTGHTGATTNPVLRLSSLRFGDSFIANYVQANLVVLKRRSILISQ